MNNTEKRLLHTVDCTESCSGEHYFSFGAVKVTTGRAGRYREAEGKPLSRFGYRFSIDNVGKPHMAVVRYPDDKRRFMVIHDGTSYDLSTGITTGWSQPLSNTMLTLKQVFWPRWNDCSIVFMTWGYGEPAAAASIEIYELADLPKLDVPQASHSTALRELGIQYEDPYGTGASEGATTFEEWLDHVVTYARHTGQTLLSYPICWYHGPLFPSRREPADAYAWIVARDRKQYEAWTGHPPDWPSRLLTRFAKEGLKFQGVLTLLRLGSLMRRMNIDLDAIKAGADTINNMLWNNHVQAGTMDWTPTYNTRNYAQRLAYFDAGKDFSGFPYVYGEKVQQPYHAGPIFNPVHPVVQKAVIGFVREIGQRYGVYPSFKGIAITMWAPTIIWFGSIHSGYDDYTIRLFEKETGIAIPVDGKAPDRFSQRYDYLMFVCKPAWVAWRCRQIHALLRKMRDTLKEGRKDLRLTLNLWHEPYAPALFGTGKVQQQFGSRRGLLELWREAGLDLALLQQEPGIELDLETDGGQRDRTASESPNAPLEHFCVFRDHDHLDQDTLNAVGNAEKPGVFIFNAWHEAWGKYRWFRVAPDDSQAKQVSRVYGKKAEGIVRMNSEYPRDGFWWNSQLRITHALQAGVHFMEQYAHAVAELDALRITRGGLFLEKGHGEEIGKFSRAFRALPAKKFQTVGRSTDPVALRTLVHGKRRYVYIINRDYYEVAVDVCFSRVPGNIADLSSGILIRAARQWKLKLGPYELRSFSMDPEIGVIGFDVKAPAGIVRGIVKEAQSALALVEKVESMGRFVPGMQTMACRIRKALKGSRYAWLRRALTGYIIRKCREISSSAGHERAGSAKNSRRRPY